MAPSKRTKRGPYEVLSAIGTGGMGEAYKARDHPCRVAGKVLRTTKSSIERRRRFLQETRAASALNHPNIVTLYALTEQDAVDYLVIEFGPGKPLDKAITTKGLRMTEALDHASLIANGLATADGR